MQSQSFSRFNLETMTPTKNPFYVEWGHSKRVNSLVKTKKFFSLYLYGISGAGKNEMIENACAVNSRPVVRVAITRDTKEDHLMGSKTLVDGNIKYETGPVKWAAENGAVLILDEISKADANEIMCLQNVLEGKPFFVKSANEMVTPKEGFCIIATDNTKGRGDDTGRYIGSNILDDAFLERFMMFMEQPLPTESIERKIYEKHAQKLNVDISGFIDRLLPWVSSTRKTYAAEAINEQITPRRGCHIIQIYSMINDENDAIELGISRFDETTIRAMTQYWEATQARPEVTEQEKEQVAQDEEQPNQ